jgi:hypothetical protein
MLVDLLARLRRGRLAPLAAALVLAVLVGVVGAALNLRPHGGPRVAAGHAADTPAASPTPTATPAPPTAEPTPQPTPAPTPTPASPAPTPVPTRIPPPPAPVLGGRVAPAMAWDGNTGTVLLFGGSDSGGDVHGDTWSWNGARWTLLHPPTSPSPRSGSAMGWDPVHHQVVLFGGGAVGPGTAMNFDTWTWDGHTWTRRHPATTPQIWLLPSGTEGFMAFDPVHSQLVMVGPTQFANDTTWTWDGTDWTVHGGETNRASGTPPAWDPVTQRLTLVLPGGPGQTAGVQWTWNGSNWDAAPLADPSMVPVTVLGTDGTRGLVAVDLHGVTWRWDGATWQRDAAAGQAPVRGNAAIASDPVHGTVLVNGGTAVTPQPTSTISSTAVWDGTRWWSS